MPDPQAKSLQEIDRELLNLIDSRSLKVAELAASDSLPPVGQSHLEQNRAMDSFCRTSDRERSPKTIESLRQALRHIDSHCRCQIAQQSVSFLGPKYSYSHLAAIKYFGEATPLAPVASIPAVFDAVHRGDSVSGLVPIENSTDGRVVDTLGMFVRRHMQICGEVLLPIHHNLLATGKREQITEIHSKPQALSQCRAWLAANFPAANLVEVLSLIHI